MAKFFGVSAKKRTPPDRTGENRNPVLAPSLCESLIFFAFGVGSLDPTPTNEIIGLAVLLGCTVFDEWLSNQFTKYDDSNSPYTDSPNYNPAPPGDIPVFSVHVDTTQGPYNAAEPLDGAVTSSQCPPNYVIPEEEVTRRSYNGSLVLIYAVVTEDINLKRKEAKRISVVNPKSDLFPANWTGTEEDELAAIRTRIEENVPLTLACGEQVVWFQPDEYKRRMFSFTDHAEGRVAINKIYTEFSQCDPSDILYSNETTDKFLTGDYVLISAQFYKDKTKGAKVVREWTISF